MDKVKLVFIGSGNMGGRFARIASQLGGVEVTAVCDKSKEAAEKLGKELNVKYYPDHKAMLAAHPDAHGAVVTTPEWAHAGPALDAIAAGMALFLEKPVADTVADSRAIIDAAKKKGTLLLVDHTVRFDPRYIAAQEAVKRGDIGETVSVCAKRNVPLVIGAYVNGRTNLPMFLGVHETDLICWITGKRVKKVFAREVVKTMAKSKTHDAVLSLLTLENGAVASCELSWQVPPTQGRAKGQGIQIRGTEGVVDIDTYEQGVGIFNAQKALHPDTVYMPTVYGKMRGVWPFAFTHFTDCIRENKAAAVNPEDAHHAVEVAAAMMESIASGREVDIA